MHGLQMWLDVNSPKQKRFTYENILFWEIILHFLLTHTLSYNLAVMNSKMDYKMNPKQQ